MFFLALLDALNQHVPVAVKIIIAIAALVGALGLLRKKVYLPIKKKWSKVDAGLNTLLGYPAVKDPGTGRELQKATPALADRVYELEQTNKQVADAITVIAQVQKENAERSVAGEQIIAEWTKWRTEHEAEAAERTEHILALIQAQSEQAGLWEVVRTTMAVEGTRKIVEADRDHTDCGSHDEKQDKEGNEDGKTKS